MTCAVNQEKRTSCVSSGTTGVASQRLPSHIFELRSVRACKGRGQSQGSEHFTVVTTTTP